MKNVLNGTMACRKHFFGGQLTQTTRIHTSGTCIKRILPATDKISVPCGSVSGRFHCVTTCCGVTQIYVNTESTVFTCDTYAWIILR